MSPVVDVPFKREGVQIGNGQLAVCVEKLTECDLTYKGLQSLTVPLSSQVISSSLYCLSVVMCLLFCTNMI